MRDGHSAAQRADSPRDLSVGREGGQAGGQVGGQQSVAAGQVVDARRVSGERGQNWCHISTVGWFTQHIWEGNEARPGLTPNAANRGSAARNTHIG